MVLTAGTFLNGVIHIGDRRMRAAGWAIRPHRVLRPNLAELALPVGRLKTGTPPRLDGRTIDWARLDIAARGRHAGAVLLPEPGPEVRQISLVASLIRPRKPTRSCGITCHAPPCMVGHIEGVGPRYCPSIEDKVVRFADKTSHQVFLEPEGLDDHTIYPNGLSTSLPEDVQHAYIRIDSRA